MDKNEKPKAMGEVIQIDEARIRDHLGAPGGRGHILEAGSRHGRQTVECAEPGR